MAQESMFWDTAGNVGDGGDTYSAGQVRALFRAAFQSDQYAIEGVLAGVLNSLAVSGASSPLSVASGCALVQGIYYQNTASVSVSVTTPTAGTTGHRVVLAANWAAQTVRIALVSSADGVSSYPALTQNEYERWELPLADVSIDTAGAITLVDSRIPCRYATALIYARQGGSASDWSTAGTATYRPGGVFLQRGVTTLNWNADNSSDTTVVTFPEQFGHKPHVQATLISAGTTQLSKLLATIESVTSTQVTLRGVRTDGSGAITTSAAVSWSAFGPR